MDCVRTAIRNGAEGIRRDQVKMPGSPKEFHNAVKEGVRFYLNSSPLEIRHEENGMLCIEAEQTRMGEESEDGRQRVEILRIRPIACRPAGHPGPGIRCAPRRTQVS